MKTTAPTLWCCDECHPHVLKYVKRLLGQIARKLEEEQRDDAPRVLRHIADTLTHERP